MALTTLATAHLAYSGDKTSKSDKPDNNNVKVVLASEVKWTHLNPKRGDLAPKAGTLWGDRNGIEPTGFLLKPTDGFKSPPHIHNVSYRGVVIRGLIHNDDPNAAGMWMPAGSFWTQPRGEVHITAAQGTDTLAYIEIEKGPYLVLPKEDAFDSGERPINIYKSNVVWLNASDITWIDQPGLPAFADAPQIAFLWGKLYNGQLNGSFVKLPARFVGTIRSNALTFGAVVVNGQLQHQVPGVTKLKSLDPGSYFSSSKETVHQISSNPAEECIIYVRTDGRFEVIPKPLTD